MKKLEKGKQVRKIKAEAILPLERENFVIIGVGLLSIALGYVALSQNTVEGFFPLVVAPVLLILGYCVIVPVGIMYRKKDKPSVPPAAPTTEPSN